jgi:hypothetical protein
MFAPRSESYVRRWHDTEDAQLRQRGFGPCDPKHSLGGEFFWASLHGEVLVTVQLNRAGKWSEFDRGRCGVRDVEENAVRF